MTLEQSLAAAGIPAVRHKPGDALRFPSTPQARAVLDSFPPDVANSARYLAVNGQQWIEVNETSPATSPQAQDPLADAVLPCPCGGHAVLAPAVGRWDTSSIICSNRPRCARCVPYTAPRLLSQAIHDWNNGKPL